MKETIGKVVLNYQYYSGKDLYSDGPIEEELLEAAASHTEEELGSFIKEQDKWEFLYHFSSVRHNIVRGLAIEEHHSVLEIGAGCGAVTGALAKKAGKVTCIELSKMRSMINANRNRNKDNIEIMVGNFNDIEPQLQEKYDYITLIGVYEYAALYIGGENPYQEFLLKIKEHLKPTGKIVIAIENKMGLKYWAGCVEDHTGAWFDGIENYESVTSVKTFTRKELEQLFAEVGMQKWEFYYPYPDYKLPFKVFTDDRLPQVGELREKAFSYDRERICLFDDGKAFDNIIQNDLFPVFSNSYLIVVGGEEMVPEHMGYQQYPGEICITPRKGYSLKELMDAKKTCEGYVDFQIFWDFGTGFCEEQSKIMEIKPEEDGMICLQYTLPKGIVAFRIDPGNTPCIVDMHVCDEEEREIVASTCNGVRRTDGKMEFDHTDPWYVYEVDKDIKQTISVKAKYTRMN